MSKLNVFGDGVATAKPDFRTVGDNSLCVINVAFNRSYKKNDEWKNEPTFVKVNVWGKKAETLAKMVDKGTPLAITGYLKQENWEANDGQKRTGFSINADTCNVCVKTNGNNNNGESKNNAPSSQEPVSVPDDGDDDSVPF